MSIFPKSQRAGAARSVTATQAALIYAALLVVMALGQLFTFETFLDLFSGAGIAHVIVPLIVASEVFAVPFLLRMQLSPAFRVFSMVLGWVVAIAWLGITLWFVLAPQAVATVGFLGTVGDLTPGWWAVFVSLAFVILAAWASWGLWPFARKPVATKK